MQEQITSFTSPSGGTLNARVWRASAPRGSLVFLHGWGDHGGRCAPLAQRLVAAGFSCFAPDLAGHGLSAGPRARVHGFEPLLRDLRALLEQLVQPAPVFLCGHSMGGCLAAHYAIRHPAELAGVIFNSGALAVNRAVPRLKRSAAWLLGGLVPNLPLGALKRPAQMAHGEAAQAEYREDALIHHGPIDAGTGRCLLLANRWLEQQRHRLQVPFLALQGDADELVCPRGPAALVRAAAARGKVVEFAGARHDLLLELGADALSAAMLAWLSEQLPNRDDLGLPKAVSG